MNCLIHRAALAMIVFAGWFACAPPGKPIAEPFEIDRAAEVASDSHQIPPADT